MTKRDAERYIAGFDAVADANRIARLRRGPDVERSVRLALAIRDFAAGCERNEVTRASREAGVQQVRQTWARLRQALAHGQ